MTAPKDKGALVPEVIDPEGDQLPVINGKRVTLHQLEIFSMWRKGIPNREIESKLGLRKGYVKEQRYRAAWFKHLEDVLYTLANQNLLRDIISHDGELVEAYGKIVKGERKDDKSAMSQIRAMELRTQFGRKPILNKRGGDINIQQINTGGDGSINVLALATMTQDELLEMRETGTIPPRITEGNG